ncbi:hypothetical protein BH11PLA2_BH11PLA2_34610 [soil metagenome]
MKVIKDSDGKSWTLNVLTGTIQRIRAMVNVDLLKLIEGELVMRLYQDLATAVDCLYYACEVPADLTLDGWRNRWRGDAIEVALEQLLRDTADFFPKARQGVVHKMIDSAKEFLAAAIGAAEAQMQVEKTKFLATMSANSVGTSSGSSPESSVLTLPVLPAAS